MTDHVAAAFRAEAHALAAVLAGLPGDDWQQPTRCTPWRVGDVVAHVVAGIGRLPRMLDGPGAAAEADAGAAGYFRGGDRFSAATNTERVAAAQSRAAGTDPDTLVRDLTEAARAADDTYRAADPHRLVRTRHGDTMRLADFLTTRVVEVAVHGLDVTDALGMPPALTPAGADLLPRALLGPDFHQLGWDPVTLLRKVTGRDPLWPEETDRLTRLGGHRLAFS
jgi:uncharacterized protein (TIGR03083 family)